MCQLIKVRLSKRGYEIASCGSASEALNLLGSREFDVVVTDLNMREMNGLDLCERIVGNRPDVPVVVMTAHGSMETAIEAMRVGACDFITKPFEFDVLRLTIDRAITRKNLEREVKRLRRAVSEAQHFDGLVGASPAMKQVLDLLHRTAELETSVLLSGESGTGKGLAARALHDHSRRRGGPFVAVNCAAVPEALLESELFGHTKGAFTDAKQDRLGLFLQAQGGTLFLDEIGEMPLRLQPKLLRVMQEHLVRPLGGDKEVPCDVRLITATNRDLEAAVADGTFREDLYYRINVLHVDLPPLRARAGDVLLYAQHFIEQFAGTMNKGVVGLSSGAAEKLVSYSWPGNVRELQNAMERAVALTNFEQIAVVDLPERIRKYRKAHVLIASENPSELVTLEEVERRYMLRVLEATGGNKTKAAAILGVDRRTLYRKFDGHNGHDEARELSIPPASTATEAGS
jgi:two-component system response regulator HydG